MRSVLVIGLLGYWVTKLSTLVTVFCLDGTKFPLLESRLAGCSSSDLAYEALA